MRETDTADFIKHVCTEGPRFNTIDTLLVQIIIWLRKKKKKIITVDSFVVIMDVELFIHILSTYLSHRIRNFTIVFDIFDDSLTLIWHFPFWK